MNKMFGLFGLCALIAACVLSGCQGIVNPTRTTGPSWKPINIDPAKATVYVYELSPHQYQRPGPGRTAKYTWPLYVDGRYHDLLKPNTFLAYPLSPGRHKFRLKIDGEGDLAATNKTAQVVVNVAAGQIIFLKFDHNDDAFKARGYVKKISRLYQIPNKKAISDLRSFQLTAAPFYEAEGVSWGQNLEPGFSP
jgi:hypothetical protein